MIFPETNGLLAQQLATTRARSPLAFSVVLHGAACGLLLLGFERTPRIAENAVEVQPVVRVLDAPVPELQALRAPAPTLAPAEHPASSPADAGVQWKPEPPPSLAVKAPAARQTLIQPDMPLKPPVIQNVPVPSMVMWSASAFPSGRLVLPAPQNSVAVVEKPSLAPPNREQRVDNLQLSAAVDVSTAALPPSSNTAPLPSLAHPSDQKFDQTTAVSHELPTPAAILSASDVPAHSGPIVVPPGNMSAHDAARPDRSGLGLQGSSGSTPTGAPDAGAKTSSKGTGDAANPTEARLHGSGSYPTSTPAGSAGEAKPGIPGGAGRDSVIHISRPKDGQFGVVVLGASLAEEYPETVGVWGGRLTYSVYLPGAGGKNWILQYGVPVQGVAGGRPEAPWPYEMVQPKRSTTDDNAEAILVHGIVSTAGRLEQLAVVSPAGLPQAKGMLNALRQWQFRPPTQNGQPTIVEVLLIIPPDVD